jgi:hypothetical protein
MLHSDLYSDIKNAYLDWMDDQENTGGNVSDNALSTLNRAQANLERYDSWDLLVKDAALSLSGVTANLPSDYGEMIGVYIDTNSDGKPDFWYYRDSTDCSNGYKIRTTFAKATGYSGTITFYGTPQNTPYIRYKPKLTAFTGSGTEYSFFPFDLLLVEAQYIHITESGLVGPDYDAIRTRRKELLRDFRQEHQYKNHDMRIVQNDDRGYPVYNGGYSMTGDMPVTKDGFDNDYDRISYAR